MSDEFKIKPASRQGVVPLIMLYAESGCGKTFSALLLARGIAGEKGEIVLGDSEERRGSTYADIPEIGGYSVIDFTAPFTPAKYRGVLQAIYDARPAVAIIDSLSHEWEGAGGVLDMAMENERTGKPGLHNWRAPKLEHAKMVQMLLHSPMPIIVCIRAKYKTRQVKDENGRTLIVKDDKTSPIQAEDLIFESTAHAEILPDHSIILTKCGHPQLRDCFPLNRKGPLTVEHGRKIAEWCRSGGSPIAPTAPQRDNTPNDDSKALKAKLWGILKPTVKKADMAFDWLVQNQCIDPAADMATISVAELQSVIKLVEEKLK